LAIAGSLRRSFPCATPGPKVFTALDNARVRAALDWFTPQYLLGHDQQLRITEIPAPPFRKRSALRRSKESLARSRIDAQIDKTGNVIGELPRRDEKEVVAIAPTSTPVFPPART